MRTYYNFGAGWEKTSNKDGSFYISGLANKAANGEKKQVRIQAVNEDGVAVDITSFAVMPNKSKKEDKHPDVYFTFSIED